MHMGHQCQELKQHLEIKCLCCPICHDRNILQAVPINGELYIICCQLSVEVMLYFPHVVKDQLNESLLQEILRYSDQGRFINI